MKRITLKSDEGVEKLKKTFETMLLRLEKVPKDKLKDFAVEVNYLRAGDVDAGDIKVWTFAEIKKWLKACAEEEKAAQLSSSERFAQLYNKKISEIEKAAKRLGDAAQIKGNGK